MSHSRDKDFSVEKEELYSKILMDETLTLKLESSLSNQEAEREAYKKLVDKIAKLQKQNYEMRAKIDEMEGSHVKLVAEVKMLREFNQDHKQTISQQKVEMNWLKETYGGYEYMRDMQEKLIRLSNDQEDKDNYIHRLEGDLESQNFTTTEGGNSVGPYAQQSTSCMIM